MLQRTSDGKCERWYESWWHVQFYDEKCDGCKNIVQVGKRKFCGETSGRVSLHQVIRTQIGCTWCKNYSKKLDSTACLECINSQLDAEPFKIHISDENNELKKKMEEKNSKKVLQVLPDG